uniref:Uncharacterized protein n=1 Tax=Anguilla anguilla TaxID=7936 RepID=A0A0E9RLI8_ANGAN
MSLLLKVRVVFVEPSQLLPLLGLAFWFLFAFLFGSLIFAPGSSAIDSCPLCLVQPLKMSPHHSQLKVPLSYLALLVPLH